MPTFTYPLLVKRNDVEGPGPFRTPFIFQTTVDTGRTGTAIGTTTLPLFVAPAGATFDNVFVDVIDPYDNTLGGTNVALGITGAVDRILTATSVNTVGRRVYSPTSVQVSVNSIPLVADTQINAVVSIQTSAVTTGRVLLTVVMK